MREQIAFTPTFPGRFRLPQRELRIKVWEDEEVTPAGHELPAEQHNGLAGTSQNERRKEQASVPPDRPQEKAREDQEVEDLPTVHLPSTSAAGKDSVSTSPGRPFPAQSYRQTGPSQMSPGQFMGQRQQGFSAQVNPNQAPVLQRPVTPAMPPSHPGIRQATPLPAPAVGAPGATPSPVRPATRKSKMPLVVVLVMLLALVVGGLFYWIIAFQPFSVPAVTSTSLPFRNANLGIALQYPQGWTTQFDSAHQTVSFSDANRVDQVNISVTPGNGSSVTAFLNKEVTQLGLTAQKNLSPVTFAGTNWQQVQGTILVSGATDTETVLVALHRNHFYTIVQVAPAATYSDANHLFFSMLRASFQFL